MSSHTSPPLHEDVYIPEVDLENFEDYAVGGFHPTVIGDTFHNGRYEVAHKLGFGGFSTVWLARDNHLERYVSLKIMVAHESSKSTEGSILQLLSIRDGPAHQGQQFIPRLLDQFSFDSPNGRHTCLVQEPAGCSIAASKNDSINFLFPVETARSIAAQLIMGVAYLHSRGVCHGGMFIQPSIHHFDPTTLTPCPNLHTRNFLLSGPNLDSVSPAEIHKRYRLDKLPSQDSMAQQSSLGRHHMPSTPCTSRWLRNSSSTPSSGYPTMALPLY